MHLLKTSCLRNTKSFQLTIVENWNSSAKNITKLIVPPVSEQDEVTTDGMGIAVIEILYFAGILSEKNQHQNHDN